MSKHLEEVTWRDAAFWVEPGKLPKDYLVKTVGWVSKTKKFLVIHSEKTPEGYRAVTIVPRGMVKERRRL